MRRRGAADVVRSAHSLITRSIGTSILRGDYAAGSLLPSEGELLERFAVSRTALREALKTLTAKGLVVSKTKVGTRVLAENNWNMFDSDILAWRLELGMDRRFLGSLFEIRQALEPCAAALAATRRSEADLERLRASLDRMDAARYDLERFTAADLDFHLGIIEAAGNGFMQSIESLISTALTSAFTLSSPVDRPDDHERSVRQHRAVFDAIAGRNPQAAGDAMCAVISQGARSAGVLDDEKTIARLDLRAYGG